MGEVGSHPIGLNSTTQAEQTATVSAETKKQNRLSRAVSGFFLNTKVETSPTEFKEEIKVAESPQKDSRLSKMRRNSMSISRNALKQILHKEISANTATPGDVDSISQKSLKEQLKTSPDSVFVIHASKLEENKSTKLISKLFKSKDPGKVYYDLSKAKFITQGATALVYSVPSENAKGPDILLKLARGHGKEGELASDTAIVKKLNKNGDSRGIQPPPFELRVITDATKNQILEHTPSKEIEGVPVHDTVLVGVLFNEGSLKSQMTNLKPTERIEVAIDLCYGMETMNKKGLINLDLKPGNVLVEEKNNQKRGAFTDFGAAAFESSIHENPDLLYTIDFTNSTSADTLVEKFMAARREAVDNPDLSPAQKHAAVKEAIAAAKECMAFSFGVLLFNTFSQMDGNREIAPFLVKQLVENPETKALEEKNVESLSFSGTNRIAQDSENYHDLGEPFFNAAAIQSAPAPIQRIIKGLLEPDPSKRMSLDTAFTQVKAYERSMAK